MSPHTPTPPQPAPHPRGVFRDEHAVNGRVSCRVYACHGRLIAEISAIEGCLGALSDALWLFLEKVCPGDPSAHGASCVAGRGHLRVLP
jgi:hypothetical protein